MATEYANDIMLEELRALIRKTAEEIQNEEKSSELTLESILEDIQHHGLTSGEASTEAVSGERQG